MTAEPHLDAPDGCAPGAPREHSSGDPEPEPIEALHGAVHRIERGQFSLDSLERQSPSGGGTAALGSLTRNLGIWHLLDLRHCQSTLKAQLLFKNSPSLNNNTEGARVTQSQQLLELR